MKLLLLLEEIIFSWGSPPTWKVRICPSDCFKQWRWNNP